MKALLVSLGVVLAFGLFFAAFLVAPAIVILVGYVVMTWQAKRRKKRAQQRAAAAPAPDGAPA